MPYKPNYPTVGLNHVGSYQVSGQPYVTGGINASRDEPYGQGTGGAQRINFPYITRWVQVINKDSNNTCKVGFSKNGVDAVSGNYFLTLAVSSQTDVLELKVSELWVSGSDDVEIIAGLTSIEEGKVNTDDGASWSGSSGVG